MSRYSNIFGSSTTTSYTVPINRGRNLTIEDINSAIIENDEKLVMEALSNTDISINQTIVRDPYRNTLLHTAIEMGNVKIIQKLIDMGADLRIKNKKGESCADKLSKSHLGSIIQHIADKSVEQIRELTVEVNEKKRRIDVLEKSVEKLEEVNNRVVTEKQVFEVEVMQLRKRKIELEETNAMLRQATKKSKN